MAENGNDGAAAAGNADGGGDGQGQGQSQGQGQGQGQSEGQGQAKSEGGRHRSGGSVPDSPSAGHELSQQSLVSQDGKAPTPRVGLIMGSDSDWATMEDAAQALLEFDVPFEVGVVSAHRTPRKMLDYAETAADRGVRVIIAGAGGAAHLPGMVAASTPLPVIGVPVPLARLDGMDSLLSIVQMPGGVPVATVSIGGARNAGLLAVRILAASDPALQRAMLAFQSDLEQMVHDKDEALRRRLLG